LRTADARPFSHALPSCMFGIMKDIIVVLGVLALAAVACDREKQSQARAPSPVATVERKLFLDVHRVGPGKLTPEAVAGAHQKDLATEGKYGVDLKAYWLDEKQGNIYCLAEAESAQALNAVHKEAHGLLADEIMQVTADNGRWAVTPGAKLYLDVHHLGAGKVTAKAVAEAHQKDLAHQAKFQVKYLNYWLDEASGTIMCLTEAPSAEAALAVHQEAHGLMPDSIEEVSEGR
jgi:Protein of unknown function (DUF4242)